MIFLDPKKIKSASLYARAAIAMPRGRPKSGRTQYVRIKLCKGTHELWTDMKRRLSLKSDDAFACRLITSIQTSLSTDDLTGDGSKRRSDSRPTVSFTSVARYVYLYCITVYSFPLCSSTSDRSSINGIAKNQAPYQEASLFCDASTLR